MRAWTVTVELEINAESEEGAGRIALRSLQPLDDSDVISYDVTDVALDELREDVEDEAHREQAYGAMPRVPSDYESGANA